MKNSTETLKKNNIKNVAIALFATVTGIATTVAQAIEDKYSDTNLVSSVMADLGKERYMHKKSEEDHYSDTNLVSSVMDDLGKERHMHKKSEKKKINTSPKAITILENLLEKRISHETAYQQIKAKGWITCDSDLPLKDHLKKLKKPNKLGVLRIIYTKEQTPNEAKRQALNIAPEGAKNSLQMKKGNEFIIIIY